jgi:hypothetical protein
MLNADGMSIVSLFAGRRNEIQTLPDHKFVFMKIGENIQYDTDVSFNFPDSVGWQMFRGSSRNGKNRAEGTEREQMK